MKKIILCCLQKKDTVYLFSEDQLCEDVPKTCQTACFHNALHKEPYLCIHSTPKNLSSA